MAHRFGFLRLLSPPAPSLVPLALLTGIQFCVARCHCCGSQITDVVWQGIVAEANRAENKAWHEEAEMSVRRHARGRMSLDGAMQAVNTRHGRVEAWLDKEWVIVAGQARRLPDLTAARSLTPRWAPAAATGRAAGMVDRQPGWGTAKHREAARNGGNGGHPLNAPSTAAGQGRGSVSARRDLTGSSGLGLSSSGSSLSAGQMGAGTGGGSSRPVGGSQVWQPRQQQLDCAGWTARGAVACQATTGDLPLAR